MIMTTTSSKKTKKKKKKNASQFNEVWRRMKKNKTAMVGLAIFAIFVIMAIFADVIVPYEMAIKQNALDRLQTPSAQHWFGTDDYGRDVFARIVHGSRVSMSIGLVTSMAALVFGGLIGAACGYYGGTFDSIVMRIMDAFMCIPWILLSLAMITALGPSLINLMLAIAIASIPGTVRLVRSAILTVVEQDYVESARSYGTSDFRIIVKYILPNALGPIIVNTTMSIAGIILAAAGLSFIGMGIQPPAPEWGAMLSTVRIYMRSAPYLLYFPGIAILLAALSLNLIGDGLRDALDPKLRN